MAPPGIVTIASSVARSELGKEREYHIQVCWCQLTFVVDDIPGLPPMAKVLKATDGILK